MIRLDMPVIVEGKYDKITLENIIDAPIIKTDGFGIFKSSEKIGIIRELHRKCGGVIVITDSDSAGNMLRAYIKKILGDSANIINVYIPCIKGKEKRKKQQSREGFLGLEGMTPEIITEALKKSGVGTNETPENRCRITKTDMFVLGLSGNANSKELRRKLLLYLGLPENLSPNAMLDILNVYLTPEKLEKTVKLCQNGQTES